MVLAGREWGAAVTCGHRVAARVVGWERLLQPTDPQDVEGGHDLPRVPHGVVGVRVDQKIHFVAERLADRFDTLDIRPPRVANP